MNPYRPPGTTHDPPVRQRHADPLGPRRVQGPAQPAEQSATRGILRRQPRGRRRAPLHC